RRRGESRVVTAMSSDIGSRLRPAESVVLDQLTVGRQQQRSINVLDVVSWGSMYLTPTVMATVSEDAATPKRNSWSPRFGRHRSSFGPSIPPLATAVGSEQLAIVRAPGTRRS